MDADRVRFWKGVYKAGVDSPDGNGCDDMLSLLRTDVIPGARDGEFLGVVFRIKDDDDEGEDYDATVLPQDCRAGRIGSQPRGAVDRPGRINYGLGKSFPIMPQPFMVTSLE